MLNEIFIALDTIWLLGIFNFLLSFASFGYKKPTLNNKLNKMYKYFMISHAIETVAFAVYLYPRFTWEDTLYTMSYGVFHIGPKYLEWNLLNK